MNVAVLNRLWHNLMTGVLLVVVGVSAYYLGGLAAPKEPTGTVTVTRTHTTTTMTFAQQVLVKPTVMTEVVKNDFLFQMYLEKAVFQTSEPITVWFNLTYIGKTNITGEWSADPFRIRVWNQTHEINSVSNLTQVLGLESGVFEYGRSITGYAVIDRGQIEYNRENKTWARGPVIDFSPDSMYYVEGSTTLKLRDELKLTTPQLDILITGKK